MGWGCMQTCHDRTALNFGVAHSVALDAPGTGGEGRRGKSPARCLVAVADSVGISGEGVG